MKKINQHQVLNQGPPYPRAHALPLRHRALLPLQDSEIDYIHWPIGHRPFDAAPFSEFSFLAWTIFVISKPLGFSLFYKYYPEKILQLSIIFLSDSIMLIVFFTAPINNLHIAQRHESLNLFCWATISNKISNKWVVFYNELYNCFPHMIPDSGVIDRNKLLLLNWTEFRVDLGLGVQWAIFWLSHYTSLKG